MPRNELIFGLFLMTCAEVKNLGCTQTIGTTATKFYISPFSNLNHCDKSAKAININQEPGVNYFTVCCPGFCLVDHDKEPSSDNCAPICKENCTSETCKIEDNYVNGMRCMASENCTNIFISNDAMTSTNRSLTRLLYTSVGSNIISLLIILVIVYKKRDIIKCFRRTNKRSNFEEPLPYDYVQVPVSQTENNVEIQPRGY